MQVESVSRSTPGHNTGIHAALTSALFLGLAPVFGKLAISSGLPPLAVVGLRTISATLLLLFVVLLYNRSFLYIYPAGLLGCFLAGGINGIGSLLYYTALGRIDAGPGQMIYSLYPLFVAMYAWMDHQKPTRITLLRLALVPPALLLLTQTSHEPVDLLGVLFMLGASALYGLHLPINQRVLYDMPAPTVTLYTLVAMSIVVTPAMFLSGITSAVPDSTAWGAVVGLTLVTFLSRLTLFMGVKRLGGLQTALLGLGELLVAIAFSHLVLGERLSLYQWLGVFLLAVNLGLVKIDMLPQRKPRTGGWLSWLRPPGLPRDIPW